MELNTNFGKVNYSYLEENVIVNKDTLALAVSKEQRKALRKGGNTAKVAHHQFELADGRVITFTSLLPVVTKNENGKEGVIFKVKYSTPELNNGLYKAHEIVNFAEFSMPDFISNQKIFNNDPDTHLNVPNNNNLSENDASYLLVQGLEYFTNLSVRNAETLYDKFCVQNLVLSENDFKAGKSGLRFDSDDQGSYVIYQVDNDKD